MNLNQLKIALLVAISVIGVSKGAIKAETVPKTSPASLNETQLWRTPRLIQTFRNEGGIVSALSFTPDGSIVISGGQNNPMLQFWSIEEGGLVESIRGQRAGILNLDISPDGTTLVSTGVDRELNIWNLQTGEHLSTFFEHFGNVLAMTISPDSRIMVTAGIDGIQVWNLTPQRPAFILSGVGLPTYALAIHPNGYILASGHENGKVRFWNLRTPGEIAEFETHPRQITGLVFTPDGEKLITSSEDGTIKVWHLGTQQLLYTLTGHSGRIRALSLHPNGKILASAANDGVRLWNVETGGFITTLSGHTDWVQSVAFSKDGTRLATGSFDTLIRVWEVPEVIVAAPTSVVE